MESIAKMLPIITGLAAVGFAVAAYVMLFLPKLGRLVKGGELDLTAYEDRINETQGYLDGLKSTVAAFNKVNPERRARVQNMVPVTADAPGLYVQIDAIARAHDMVLVSVDALPDDKPPTATGRQGVRVTIDVAGGTYQQMKLFLTDLERSERILDVQDVVFTPSSASYGLVLHAYYFDAEKVLHPELQLVVPTGEAPPTP
jgi:hypothetical protein